MAQIVVVTGARAGVGRAAAIEFAKNGCDVALLAREPEALEQATEQLRGYGVRALAIPTDVADAAAVEAAANRVEEELGPIDLASSGYSGQLTHEPHPDNAPNNLFTPVAGNYGAHGRFDNQSKTTSWEFFTDPTVSPSWPEWPQ